MRKVASQGELTAVLAAARQIAAGLRGPVGPRELLLAAVTTHPGLVIACARNRGIEVGRLLWALREWAPIPPVAPAVMAATVVTPAAGEALTHAARSGEGQACSALIERLLDPESGSASPAGAVPDDPPPDETTLVLSRLKLI